MRLTMFLWLKNPLYTFFFIVLIRFRYAQKRCLIKVYVFKVSCFLVIILDVSNLLLTRKIYFFCPEIGVY